jgi:hypothetical protein
MYTELFPMGSGSIRLQSGPNKNRDRTHSLLGEVRVDRERPTAQKSLGLLGGELIPGCTRRVSCADSSFALENLVILRAVSNFITYLDHFHKFR